MLRWTIVSEVRGQWQHRLHQLRHTRGLTVGISNSGRVPYRDTSHRPLSAVISTTTHWLPSSTNSVRRPVGGVQPEMGGMYVARRTMTSVPSNSGESGTAPSGSDPPVKKTELKKKKTATTEAGGADAGTASAKRQDASTTPKPSTSTKVALFAKKLAVEYPKLLVTKTYEFFRLMIMEPKVFKEKAAVLWQHTKDELKHYWLGSKLLWQEMKTSTNLVKRVLSGHTLTRRERQQLLKTSADMFRLVPFAVFVIVPFMELLLPITLKLFPNMLPSTFETQSKKEETMKKQLNLRLDMALFLQDTVQEMAKSLLDADAKGDKKGAKELMELIEAVRSGKPLPNESIVACAKIFTDEITLDNISRAQLVGMSRYMGLNPYGTDNFLRFQLRNKIRAIKADDQMIMWEGIDSLTIDELRKACAERGMRAVGLTEAGYRRQLREWLDLSHNKSVPTSLLILSRAFTITQADMGRAIQDSISALDEEVLTEAVLESAAKGSKADEDVLREMRLESIEYQNEMIEAEREQAGVKVGPTVKLAAETAQRVQQLEGVTATQQVQPLLTPPQAQQELASHAVQTAGEIITPQALTVPPKPAVTVPIPVSSNVMAIAIEAGVLEMQKEVLDKVKATRLKLEGQVMLSKGRIKSASQQQLVPEGVDDTKSVSNVKKKLDQLLKGIEDDLDAADEALEGKMKALESATTPTPTAPGVASDVVEELKAKEQLTLEKTSPLHALPAPDRIRSSKAVQEAVAHILGSHNPEEAAVAIERLLKEPQAHGTITAEELRHFADAMLEAERRKDAASEPTTPPQ